MMDLFWREQPDGTAYLAALLGLDVDINAGTGLGAACALELGDMERYSALRGFMEDNYEPAWDADTTSSPSGSASTRRGRAGSTTAGSCRLSPVPRDGGRG
jgi:hypothetical protein